MSATCLCQHSSSTVYNTWRFCEIDRTRSTVADNAVSQSANSSNFYYASDIEDIDQSVVCDRNKFTTALGLRKEY